MNYRQKIIIIAYILIVCPASCLSSYTISWGVSARQGERNYMEDYFTATELTTTASHSANKKCYLFGIYDGHGGSVISEELKNTLPIEFRTRWERGKAIPDALKHSLETIENDLKPTRNKHHFDSHNEAGSAAVVAIVDHTNRLYCANVGDSRAIVIRNGTVVFSTEDHKPHMSKEFFRLVQAGYTLDSSDPNRTPRIKRFSLSRTIGDWNTKLTHPGAIIGTPDLYTFEIEAGDLLIMASDGLWDVVTNQDIARLVQKIMKHGMVNDFISLKTDKKYDITDGNTPQMMQEVAKALRDVAYEFNSNDNITVIAAQFSDSPITRSKTTTQDPFDILIHNAQELHKILGQKQNNGLPRVAMHLNLIIDNATELQKVLHQEKNHGSPQKLFDYIDESVRFVTRHLKTDQGRAQVLLHTLSSSLQQIQKEMAQ